MSSIRHYVMRNNYSNNYGFVSSSSFTFPPYAENQIYMFNFVRNITNSISGLRYRREFSTANVPTDDWLIISETPVENISPIPK